MAFLIVSYDLMTLDQAKTNDSGKQLQGADNTGQKPYPSNATCA